MFGVERLFRPRLPSNRRAESVSESGGTSELIPRQTFLVFDR